MIGLCVTAGCAGPTNFCAADASAPGNQRGIITDATQVYRFGAMTCMVNGSTVACDDNGRPNDVSVGLTIDWSFSEIVRGQSVVVRQVVTNVSNLNGTVVDVRPPSGSTSITITAVSDAAPGVSRTLYLAGTYCQGSVYAGLATVQFDSLPLTLPPGM